MHRGRSRPLEERASMAVAPPGMTSSAGWRADARRSRAPGGPPRARGGPARRRGRQRCARRGRTRDRRQDGRGPVKPVRSRTGRHRCRPATDPIGRLLGPGSAMARSSRNRTPRIPAALSRSVTTRWSGPPRTRAPGGVQIVGCPELGEERGDRRCQTLGRSAGRRSWPVHGSARPTPRRGQPTPAEKVALP